MYKFSNKELEEKIDEIREELEKREKDESTVKWDIQKCDSEIMYSCDNFDKIFIRLNGLLIDNEEAKINLKEFFLSEKQIGLGYYDDQRYYIVYDESENVFNLIKETPTLCGNIEYNYYYLTESDISNLIKFIENNV
jgi:hypothetical protein